MEGVSVIICTYNGAKRLPATLKHIAAQQVAGIAWEVIVVDNNSNDDTTALAYREWAQYGTPVPFRVVQENRPGVYFAREKGVESAKYELILYCDDDNWLKNNYVSTAFALMKDETIGVAGGLNIAVADTVLPEWFKSVEVAFACGPQADKDGDIAAGRLYITCAGMVTRKKIYKTLAGLNFSSQLVGRSEGNLTSGEDTEFSILSALLGYRLVYSASLVLEHYMETKRLNWAYFLNLTKGHAQSGYKIGLYKQLYHQGELSTDWMAYFQGPGSARDRLYRLRRAVRWWRMYSSKRQLQVGDTLAVEAFSNVETWKMHLRFRREYKTFVMGLNELGRNLRKQRLIVNSPAQ